MDEDKRKQLKVYLDLVGQLAFEMLEDDPKLTAIEVLRYATNIVEGQVQGY